MAEQKMTEADKAAMDGKIEAIARAVSFLYAGQFQRMTGAERRQAFEILTSPFLDDTGAMDDVRRRQARETLDEIAQAALALAGPPRG